MVVTLGTVTVADGSDVVAGWDTVPVVTAVGLIVFVRVSTTLDTGKTEDDFVVVTVGAT